MKTYFNTCESCGHSGPDVVLYWQPGGYVPRCAGGCHDTYQYAVQDASRQALIEIQPVERPERTQSISGHSPAANLIQAMLNEVVGADYLAQGFRLISVGRLIKLYYQDEVAFIFDEDLKPTIQMVRATCFMYLKKINGGEKC